MLTLVDGHGARGNARTPQATSTWRRTALRTLELQRPRPGEQLRNLIDRQAHDGLRLANEHRRRSHVWPSPSLLSWYAHRDGEFVRAVSLVELSPDGDRIARLRNYFYTPEVIVELCGELALPCRINGTFRARADA